MSNPVNLTAVNSDQCIEISKMNCVKRFRLHCIASTASHVCAALHGWLNKQHLQGCKRWSGPNNPCDLKSQQLTAVNSLVYIHNSDIKTYRDTAYPIKSR